MGTTTKLGATSFVRAAVVLSLLTGALTPAMAASGTATRGTCVTVYTQEPGASVDPECDPVGDPTAALPYVTSPWTLDQPFDVDAGDGVSSLDVNASLLAEAEDAGSGGPSSSVGPLLDASLPEANAEVN